MLYTGFGFIAETRYEIEDIIRHYVPNISIYHLGANTYFIGHVYNHQGIYPNNYVELEPLPKTLELPSVLPGAHVPAKLAVETSDFLKDLFQNHVPTSYAFWTEEEDMYSY